MQLLEDFSCRQKYPRMGDTNGPISVLVDVIGGFHDKILKHATERLLRTERFSNRESCKANALFHSTVNSI